MRVPDILLSGDHQKIEGWRKSEAMSRTAARRPDLLVSVKRNARG
jgi:tRNA (guanine37-N1)-methyltransferase